MSARIRRGSPTGQETPMKRARRGGTAFLPPSSMAELVETHCARCLSAASGGSPPPRLAAEAAAFGAVVLQGTDGVLAFLTALQRCAEAWASIICGKGGSQQTQGWAQDDVRTSLRFLWTLLGGMQPADAAGLARPLAAALTQAAKVTLAEELWPAVPPSAVAAVLADAVTAALAVVPLPSDPDRRRRLQQLAARASERHARIEAARLCTPQSMAETLLQLRVGSISLLQHLCSDAAGALPSRVQQQLKSTAQSGSSSCFGAIAAHLGVADPNVGELRDKVIVAVRQLEEEGLAGMVSGEPLATFDADSDDFAVVVDVGEADTDAEEEEKRQRRQKAKAKGGKKKRKGTGSRRGVCVMVDDTEKGEEEGAAGQDDGLAVVEDVGSDS
eukprot:TRINITY_DN8266_c0_g2_i1.p1 TRINITY_DN8266_c0_g2~~TRINITY_DN8266_c0_g2_i1.p1  ORF type:complete len:412 (+),score=168.70 TRINITY_DN8266_c0_g2_i1:76-1236(+)